MGVRSTLKRAGARGVPREGWRSRRATLRLLCSLSIVGCCAIAQAADAAEVLKLRLGRHPTFTRVVFELDSPAGYSLEKNTLAGGGTELVVTLDASAADQEKSLSRALVTKVSLTGQGKRSVARIQLSKNNLRVKEMILAGPPRIVLDVLAPPAAKSTRTAKAATPTSTAAKSTSAAHRAQKPAAAEPIAKPAAKPTAVTAKPVAKKPTSVSPTAARTPAASKPAASNRVRINPPAHPARDVPPVASVNHGASPSPTRVVTRNSVVPAARPTPAPKSPAAAKPSGPTAQKPSAAAPTTATAPGAGPRKMAKTPPPPARKKPAARPTRTPVAPAAIPQSTSGSMFTARNVGGGLALLGLVGGGTFFMLRRRAGNELAQDSFAEDNPFASLGDDALGDGSGDMSSMSDATAEQPISEANVVDEFGSDDDADIPVAKVSADTGSDDTLVPGAENAAAAGDNMETHGDATVNTDMGGMPPIPGDDTTRMLREFEQRMASFESRLDAVTEAKERLERQVTAQTEELRVQRAAIARTQRALRNLTRPDDDSVTEPALREPT